MREGGGIPVDCAQSNFSSFCLISKDISVFLCQSVSAWEEYCTLI